MHCFQFLECDYITEFHFVVPFTFCLRYSCKEEGWMSRYHALVISLGSLASNFRHGIRVHGLLPVSLSLLLLSMQSGETSRCQSGQCYSDDLQIIQIMTCKLFKLFR